MTLIEIMIVLAIIGLLVLLLPRMMRTARKSDLRGDAAKMAAAMRWAYDRAASTASHHRLVVDLDADTFWVERCEGDVKMVRSPDEAKAAEEQAIVAQAAKPPEPPPDIDLSAIAGGSAAPVNPTVPTLSVAADAGSDATPLACTPVKGAQGRPSALTKRAGISV
jgi:type II secretory pathway pseudopilin PulG